MAISNAIPREQGRSCVPRAGIPVHVSEICYVDPSEAIKTMLAALALASAAFVALAVAMSH
jgi:hypothetical protein